MAWTYRILGAFTLGGPGVVEESRPGMHAIANRPGPLHWAIAALVPAGLAALWWFLLPDSPALGGGLMLLFGVPAALVAFNRQEWQVTRSEVRITGPWGGRGRAWRIPAGTRVRIQSGHDHGDVHFLVHQVVLDAEAASGKAVAIAVAESQDLAAVLACAQRVCAATGLELA